jgi:hypothetical protein
MPLVGGLDEQAGGTWLAVHPEQLRVACLLNGRGEASPSATLRSRGELPLLAALTGEMPALDVAAYNPFHLLCADVTSASLLTWDGTRAITTVLEPGTHMLTNAGHACPGAALDEKSEYFAPRFAARPELEDWLALSDGDGLAPDDPRAIRRRELRDGRLWGTSSLSLVEIGTGGLRYDFRTAAGEWHRVDLPGGTFPSTVPD